MTLAQQFLEMVERNQRVGVEVDWGVMDEMAEALGMFILTFQSDRSPRPHVAAADQLARALGIIP